MLIVENKPDRIKEISDRIDRHLADDSMTPAEAAELRGRLVFSNSQTYGRTGALAYYQLGIKAKGNGPLHFMTSDLKWALRWWKSHLQNSKPRMVRVGPQRKPLYLFTDGSCEPDEEARLGIKAAYGAVMYDPEDECVETFGAEISEELLTLLSREGSKRQIVGQSELIPCHAAQIVWKDRMIGRRIFLYTDYEAARYGLIKSTSPTQNKRLDRQTSTDPRKRPTRPTRGLRRVPSASNCADGPSRRQVRDPHRPGNQGSQVRAAARVRGGTGQTMEVE